jgi:hypothetical protein
MPPADGSRWKVTMKGRLSGRNHVVTMSMGLATNPPFLARRQKRCTRFISSSYASRNGSCSVIARMVHKYAAAFLERLLFISDPSAAPYNATNRHGRLLPFQSVHFFRVS